MKIFRRILLGLVLLAVLAVALLLQYCLPAHREVQVLGTEVKRMDQRDKQNAPATRDVRFIITRDTETLETHVFRNEDTGWGWPPYFKFDSGDVAGDALSFEQAEANPTVLVTYYGWRIPMFSMYPNVVDLERVEPGETHLPWFNMFFLTLVFGGVGFLVWKTRRAWRWLLLGPKPKDASPEGLSQQESEQPAPPQEDTSRQDESSS